jgi:hypothetical protein
VKKAMKTILLTVTTILITTVVLQAQHEFSIYGTTGFSHINYSLSTAISPPGGSIYSDNSLQSGIGLGYTYSVSSAWGIISGLEMKWYDAVVDVNSFTDRTRMVYFYDDNVEVMYFDSRLSGFNERQTAKMLQIPLLAEYRFTDYSHTWFVAAGAKFGFNASSKYTTTANRLVTSGYYPESGQTFHDMPEQGLVTRDNVSWSGKLDFGFSLMFTAETGVRIEATPRLGIYTGIYFDYGRVGVPSKSETGVITYDPDKPGTFIYNSVLRSTQQSSNEQFVNKIDLVSIGVKLKVGLKNKKKYKPVIYHDKTEDRSGK